MSRDRYQEMVELEHRALRYAEREVQNNDNAEWPDWSNGCVQRRDALASRIRARGEAEVKAKQCQKLELEIALLKKALVER